MFSAIKKWLYPPSPASFVDAKEEENEVQVKEEEVQVEVKEEEVIESIPTKKYFPIFAP